MYFAGVVFAVSAGLMLMRNVWRVITGKISEQELVTIQESEDAGGFVMPPAEPAVHKQH